MRNVLSERSLFSLSLPSCPRNPLPGLLRRPGFSQLCEPRGILWTVQLGGTRLSLSLKGVDGFSNPPEIVEATSFQNPGVGIRRETGQEEEEAEEEDASVVALPRVGGYERWKDTEFVEHDDDRSNEDLEEQLPLSSKGWRALMETYTRGIKRSVFGEPPLRACFAPIDTRYVELFLGSSLHEKTPRRRPYSFKSKSRNHDEKRRMRAREGTEGFEIDLWNVS